MLSRVSLGPISIVFLITLSITACSGGNNNNYDHKDNYEIKGAIINIVNSHSFFLGNVLVMLHDSSTRFEHGSASYLAVGKRIEIEGTRTNSGTVIAREIEFKDLRRGIENGGGT